MVVLSSASRGTDTKMLTILHLQWMLMLVVVLIFILLCLVYFTGNMVIFACWRQFNKRSSHCPWSKTYFPGCSPFAKAVANAWTHTISMTANIHLSYFFYKDPYHKDQKGFILYESCECCRVLSFRSDKWNRASSCYADHLKELVFRHYNVLITHLNFTLKAKFKGKKSWTFCHNFTSWIRLPNLVY